MVAEPPCQFISSGEFATLARLQPRVARRILAKCSAGGTWRGTRLVVRITKGRGGRSGKHYEVRVDSLPSRSQLPVSLNVPQPQLPAVIDPSPQAQLPAVIDCAPQPVAISDLDRLYHALAEIVRAAPHSRERGALIKRLAEQLGRNERSIRALVDRFQERGIDALKRAERKDAGAPRVIISRAWDEATQSLGRSRQEEIRAAIEAYIAGWYVKGQKSACKVALYATTRLLELTRASGLTLERAAEEAICTIPPHFARQFRDEYSQVEKKNRDAKRHYDDGPHIHRDASHLAPMELVEGDVHDVDVYYRRDDGSLATPKAITWYDVATQRAFVTIRFYEPRSGVTQRDVVESFIDMVCAWGWPSGLRLDNGREYTHWTDCIKDALALANLTTLGGVPRPIVRTLPYRPRGKRIEGFFPQFEQLVRVLPGYRSGELGRAKIHKLGQKTKPFPGTKEELRGVLLDLVEHYNRAVRKTSGHLKGLTPAEAFNLRVQRGWAGISVQRHVLEACLVKAESRRVRGGAITIDQTSYYSDDLLLIPKQESVIVHIPWTGDQARVEVLDDRGKHICFAEREQVYRDDPERTGSKEQSRREREQRRRLKELEAKAEDFDPMSEIRKTTARFAEQVPTPIAGALRFSDQVHKSAEARRALPPLSSKSALPDVPSAADEALELLAEKLRATG